VLAERWTERDGRAALADRCCGRCEGCGTVWHGQAAHRKRVSQGGTWSPVNLLALCGSGITGCHGLAHHHPLWAQGLGWEVLPEEDPAEHAVWLLHPVHGPGRYLLAVTWDGDGIRRHVVIPVQARWVA
jgi:hypothetical protein